ncbi:hypothetical protein BIW11_10502 [Tropilaelaps mercedesae]|uniref:Uncharacterized protein n=1 Tax=Tropilaelaps mercedesae TaxID=418985 RepID=A0A1V9XFS9_9ACAR|nr:hypothetical protein BIW11_10502 [Tropilaelaps mercedesae]
MRLVIVCALGVLAVCTSVQAVTELGDVFFDAMIGQIRNMDVVRILTVDDIRFGFEKKMGPFVLHGETKLHDGVVTGLDTMHRIGNGSVQLFNDSSMRIKGELGMGVVEFTYRGTVTFMDFGPSVKMDAYTSYVGVNTEINRDPDGNMQVIYFKIREMEALKVQFSGLGPITWVGNLLARPVLRYLKPIIKKAVEITARRIIEKKLPEILENVEFE